MKPLGRPRNPEIYTVSTAKYDCCFRKRLHLYCKRQVRQENSILTKLRALIIFLLCHLFKSSAAAQNLVFLKLHLVIFLQTKITFHPLSWTYAFVQLFSQQR